jgi:hypothetical protein
MILLIVFDRGKTIARHPVRHVLKTGSETTLLLLHQRCTVQILDFKKTESKQYSIEYMSRNM